MIVCVFWTMKRVGLILLVLVLQLLNVGEDVLLFFNDKQSFATMVEQMRSERCRLDPNSQINYHIALVCNWIEYLYGK